MGALPEEELGVGIDESYFDEWRNYTGEKGVWKAAPENLIMFNQLDINRYACTYVASLTALCNMTRKILPLQPMMDGFKEFAASGEFIEGVGAKVANGAKWAAKAFNAHFGTNYQPKVLPFNPLQVLTAIKMGKPVVGGLSFQSGLFKEIQKTGDLSRIDAEPGQNGHAICWVKVNTTGAYKMKFLDNYEGRIIAGNQWKNIILADFFQNHELFQRTGVIFV